MIVGGVVVSVLVVVVFLDDPESCRFRRVVAETRHGARLVHEWRKCEARAKIDPGLQREKTKFRPKQIDC